MRVLAIDTAQTVCAAAVLDAGHQGILARESVPMERGHAEALMPLIARVMSAAQLDFTALDRVAVTVGPGSFTGLRVGIAAARGIALAAGMPAVGLSTFSAYAAPLIAEDDNVPVMTAVDARHDQVYLQIFGVGGRTVASPRAVAIAEAIRLALPGPVRIVGSAAERVAEAWPKGDPAPALVEQRAAPDIDWVARLGAAATVPSPPKPLYLRPADAQPQEAARLARR